MKQQTQRKPMDEREKLRKFRELDDAFAEALRELDSSEAESDMPAETPVAAATSPQHVEAPARDEFEDRLRTLMQEYHKPAAEVVDLLKALEALEVPRRLA